MDGPKYYNIIENVQDKQNKNQDLRKIYVKHSSIKITPHIRLLISTFNICLII